MALTSHPVRQQSHMSMSCSNINSPASQKSLASTSSGAIWEDEDDDDNDNDQDGTPEGLEFSKRHISKIWQRESQLTLKLQKERKQSESALDVKLVRRQIIEEMSRSLRENLVHARQCWELTKSRHMRNSVSHLPPWDVGDRCKGDFLGY